jgi:hypothetical protein
MIYFPKKKQKVKKIQKSMGKASGKKSIYLLNCQVTFLGQYNFLTIHLLKDVKKVTWNQKC